MQSVVPGGFCIELKDIPICRNDFLVLFEKHS